MKIGEKTISEIKGQVEELTRAWLVNINHAYMSFGKETFAITYKVALNPGKHSGTKVETGISFPPSPNIKDKTSGHVDEDQMTIFEAEAEPCEPQLFVPKPKDWLWLVVGRARGLWFLPPNPDPDWLEITEGSLISDNWLHFCSERALDGQWFN